MLLKVYDVSAAVIETIMNLRQESVPLLVEGLSFVTIAFIRIKLIDDLVDALQSLGDLGVFRHPQSTPSQSAVMTSRSRTRIAMATL